MRKTSVIYSSVFVLLAIAFSGCGDSKSVTPPVVGNESGDIFDTITLTTLYPPKVVTSTELEITSEGDTTIVNSEKFLKLKISGGYSRYISYTGSVVDSTLLLIDIPQNYCLGVTILVGKSGFDDRQGVAVSYSIQKIVNHMGG